MVADVDKLYTLSEYTGIKQQASTSDYIVLQCHRPNLMLTVLYALAPFSCAHVQTLFLFSLSIDICFMVSMILFLKSKDCRDFNCFK